MKDKKENKPDITSAEQKTLVNRELDDCFFAANTASARDCTGTVVRGPQSDGTAEAYDEVYHYKPQIPDGLVRK